MIALMMTPAISVWVIQLAITKTFWELTDRAYDDSDTELITFSCLWNYYFCERTC